ncbi:TIGR03759 family integrating conjugative element protein [Saezia sanguinis]|uniref:TIGR03759 family integrating conjugative element protein n=1 Tax=Saezia sanguinis TaxID=1965230 RepID=UPI00302781DA
MRRNLLIVLLGCCLMVNAIAQTRTATDEKNVLQHKTTPHVQSAERDVMEQAKVWNLQIEEWARYQTLMNGPLGIYSPGLDPLTALGIEARNDAERRRYAELQVQAESLRVAKELAYQQAYDEAFKRLYPNLLPVVGLDGSQNSVVSAAHGQADSRLAVFVQENCPACDEQVKKLQAAGQSFDIYVVGSHADDAVVRRWATRAGVEPDKVRSRTITLNHDDGRWQLTGVGGALPAAIREVNGQWRRE